MGNPNISRGFGRQQQAAATAKHRWVVAYAFCAMGLMGGVACHPFEDTSQYAFENTDQDANVDGTSGATSGTSGATSGTSGTADGTSGSTSGTTEDFLTDDTSGSTSGTTEDFLTDDTSGSTSGTTEDIVIPDVIDVDVVEPVPEGCTQITGASTGDDLRTLTCAYDPDNPALTIQIVAPAVVDLDLPMLVFFPPANEDWSISDDSRGVSLSTRLAYTGVVVAYVQYARTDGGEDATSFIERTGFLTNAATATQWLHDNASTLNADSGRMTFAGFSTGGTVAMLLGMSTQWFENAAGGDPNNIPTAHGIINIAGPLEFVGSNLLTNREFSFTSLIAIANPIFESIDENIWKELDAALDPRTAERFPPMLLIPPGTSLGFLDDQLVNPNALLAAQAFMFSDIARNHDRPITLAQPIINASFNAFSTGLRRRCFLYLDTNGLLDAATTGFDYSRAQRYPGQIYSEYDGACGQTDTDGSVSDHPFVGLMRDFITSQSPATVGIPDHLRFSHISTSGPLIVGDRFNAGGPQQNTSDANRWQALGTLPPLVRLDDLFVRNAARAFVKSGRVAVNDMDIPLDPTNGNPIPDAVLHFQLVPPAGSNVIEVMIEPFGETRPPEPAARDFVFTFAPVNTLNTAVLDFYASNTGSGYTNLGNITLSNTGTLRARVQNMPVSENKIFFEVKRNGSTDASLPPLAAIEILPPTTTSPGGMIILETATVPNPEPVPNP